MAHQVLDYAVNRLLARSFPPGSIVYGQKVEYVNQLRFRLTYFASM
jgi:hypothetical protein